MTGAIKETVAAAMHLERGHRFLDEAALEDALDAYESAIQECPEWAEAYFSLGRVLGRLGRSEQAEAAYRRVLSLHPTHAEAANNLGVIAAKKVEHQEAEKLYRQALAENPDYFEPHLNLGLVLLQEDRVLEARYYLTRAVSLNRDSDAAADHLGVALMRAGRVTEAIELIEQALKLNSQSREAWVHLGLCHQRLADFEAAENAFRKSLECSPDHLHAWNCLLLMLNYSRRDKADVFRLHQEFARAATQGMNPSLHGNVPDPGRRLRLGFVSGDFRQHSVGYFVFSVLSRLPRSEFELWGYFNQPKPDRRTADFKALFYHSRDTYRLSAAEVTELIRGDKIDILVDLSGHTSHNRLAVFAAKPAPVQVSWIGYPNTTGLSQIDYRITDAYADPVGDADRYHAERLWRLPNGFLCYSAPAFAPPVSELPCLSRGYITFGSFNNRMKINRDCIALWARVLKAVPNSRMLVKSVFGLFEKESQIALSSSFSEFGIAAGRVSFHSATDSAEAHLAMYGEIDIALDTFPYNGTTTTCEALWMGVPVLTIAGDRHASRVGVSLLNNAGLADLVADDEDQFVDTAVQLAGDPESLAAIRGALRQVLKDSRLMDEAGMTRDFAQALRKMWEAYCTSTDAARNLEAVVDGDAAAADVRLFIGDGLQPEGWEIFATDAGEGVAFAGDLTDLSRFGNDHYGVVYCAHVLQRLGQGDVLDYLNNLHRILRPGGKLYLSVPDLDVLAWLLLSPTVAKAARYGLMRMMFGGQESVLDFSHIGLNIDFLTDLLVEAGFVSIDHVESFGLFDDVSNSHFGTIPVSLNLVVTK